MGPPMRSDLAGMWLLIVPKFVRSRARCFATDGLYTALYTASAASLTPPVQRLRRRPHRPLQRPLHRPYAALTPPGPTCYIFNFVL